MVVGKKKERNAEVLLEIVRQSEIMKNDKYLIERMVQIDIDNFTVKKDHWT